MRDRVLAARERQLRRGGDARTPSALPRRSISATTRGELLEEAGMATGLSGRGTRPRGSGRANARRPRRARDPVDAEDVAEALSMRRRGMREMRVA